MEWPGGGQGQLRRLRLPKITHKTRWNTVSFQGWNIIILMLNNRVKQTQLLTHTLLLIKSLLRFNQASSVHTCAVMQIFYMHWWCVYMNRNRKQKRKLFLYETCRSGTVYMCFETKQKVYTWTLLWLQLSFNDNHNGHPDQWTYKEFKQTAVYYLRNTAYKKLFCVC